MPSKPRFEALRHHKQERRQDQPNPPLAQRPAEQAPNIEGCGAYNLCVDHAINRLANDEEPPTDRGNTERSDVECGQQARRESGRTCRVISKTVRPIHVRNRMPLSNHPRRHFEQPLPRMSSRRYLATCATRIPFCQYRYRHLTSSIPTGRSCRLSIRHVLRPFVPASLSAQPSLDYQRSYAKRAKKA